MRLFALCLLLASLPSHVVGQDRQANPNKPENESHDAAAAKNPCPQVVIQSQSNQQSSDQQDAAHKNVDHSFLPSPEWVTAASTFCILLATGAYAITSLFMLLAIRKQNRHIGEQVAMQQGELRQWVNLENWHISMKDERDGIYLVFQCHAVNRTPRPLWLDAVEVKIGGGQGGMLGIATWLIPDEPFDVEVVLNGTKKQLDEFGVGQLVARVKASAFFRDSISNHWRQETDFFIISRLGGDVVEERRTKVFDSTPPIPISGWFARFRAELARRIAPN